VDPAGTACKHNKLIKSTKRNQKKRLKKVDAEN
jgi:hypothetical protein